MKNKVLLSALLMGSFLASSAVAKITIQGDARYRYSSNELHEVKDKDEKNFNTFKGGILFAKVFALDITTQGTKDIAKLYNIALPATVPPDATVPAVKTLEDKVKKAAAQFDKDFDTTVYTNSLTNADNNGAKSDDRFRFGVKIETEQGIGGYVRLRSDNGFFDSKTGAGRLRVDQAYVTAQIPGVTGLKFKAGDFTDYLGSLHAFTDLQAYGSALEVAYDSGTFSAFVRLYEDAKSTKSSTNNNLEYLTEMGVSANIQGVQAGVILRSDNSDTDADEKVTVAYVKGEYSGVNFAGEYYVDSDSDNTSFHIEASMKYGEYTIGGFYTQVGYKHQTGSEFNPMNISIFGDNKITPTSITRIKSIASKDEKIFYKDASDTTLSMVNPLFSNDDATVYGGQVKANFQGLNLQLSYGLANLNQDKLPAKLSSEVDTKLYSSDKDAIFYDISASYDIGPVEVVGTYGSIFDLTSFGVQVNLKF